MRRLIALLSIFVVVAAGCGGSDDDADDASSSAPAEQAADPDASAASDPEPEPEPEPEPDPEPAEPVFDFSGVDPVIEGLIADHDLNGAAIVFVHRDLGVIGERFWGVYDADRISLIASSSKMVAATILLALDDAGELDIDAPIADYLPYAADHPEITTAQLLSNSSGLPGLLATTGFPSYLCAFTHTGTLQECAETILTTPEDDDAVNTPDTEFDYGGVQWQIAGAVAEAASGRSWTELVDDLIVQPCGLDVFAFNNAFSQVQTAGFDHPPGFDNNPEVLVASENPNIEGGGYSNVTDYAQLLLMHLRGGACGDNQIVSPDALARMHGDRIAEVYGGDAASDPGTGYGMGWWIDRETGYISDAGAFGSLPWLDLEDGYGAFLLTESSSGLTSPLGLVLQPIVDAAIAEGLGS
ncbi:MAG: serine hydrolase domain-containing protein [Actinomycetota bacterium]